ncbi:MAG: hypothetical protein U9P38_02540 [Campylobacterota bacterium]|nr:hypothetical protein [Campylobacterota bacterium]
MTNKDELYEDISITQKYLGFSSGVFLLMILAVIFFGYYVGIVLYGTNSLSTLRGLERYKESLQTEIIKLRDENAQLQYEYFELKEATAQ